MDAIRTEHKDSKDIENPIKREIASKWTLLRAHRPHINCPEHFEAFHATSIDEKTTDEEKDDWLQLVAKFNYIAGGNKRYGYPLTRRAESR